MAIISFDARREQIKTPKDIPIQIQRADNYAKAIKAKMLKASTLSEKIVLDGDYKAALRVARQLRLGHFDIEDQIIGVS